MSGHADLAIIGAGPAGAHAALAASDAGISVLLLDEATSAGGQVWREPRTTSPIAYTQGEDLRTRLRAAKVTCRFERRIWLVEQGYTIHTTGKHGLETFSADRLIVAAGTSERVVPFEGWTLPGVFGLAATTILLKADATLPGKRTLVAGQGPLLAAVAAGLLEHGGEVAGIVDRSTRTTWLKELSALRHRPEDLKQGLAWLFNITRNKVPVRHDDAVCSVARTGATLQVRLESGEVIGCDALAIGNGLTPASEIARLLDAPITFNAELGGWVPKIDDYGRSPLKTLYFCGDGAGVRGASAACLAGELSGLAAAFDQGALAQGRFDERATLLRLRLTKASIAGLAMSRLMQPKQAAYAGMDAQTIVCRCEDVRRADLDRAIDEGAGDMNQLKAWTRCGMGPCQGRNCLDSTTAILALKLDQDRGAIAPWTARAPLRPVPMQEMIGDYDYDDIPIPAAAPL